MVQVPQTALTARGLPQDARWNVRPLQVLCPCTLERIETCVHGLQPSDRLLTKMLCSYDDEVDVTVTVEGADRERSLEIGTDEMGTQHRLSTINQVVQHPIQPGIGCGRSAIHWSTS